ncbi:YfcC family protein [Mycoplasmatota bacterium]|nr:YfcC family protein [Mycoplasmatota bacterium]
MDAIKINKKTFTSTLLILFLLLIGSGILTQIIPMGSFDYREVDGTIIEGSFNYLDGERLPIIKWFTAPFEVLGTSDGLIIIVIIVFLLIVGGALSILNKANVLSSIINIIINKYAKNKYFLLRVIILLFMSLGAFVGIFEEVIPLVPLIISLAIALGFDVMVGLGISLMAAGFGFTAGVSNPFTILVAQELADLPLFSGAFYRIIIFLITYVVVSQLIIMYARKVEKPIEKIENAEVNINKRTLYFFTVSISLMFVVVITSPFIPMLSDYNLPIIGFLFLLIGIGSGLTSTLGIKKTFNAFINGALMMLPGAVLILLANGVKHIIVTGKIMDTILYEISERIIHLSPFNAILMIYLVVFILNFFIGSGSAKAFLVMPLIVPIMDMMKISRQMSVLAFQFGDGFSNILYPTNAVLLIGIGLANVSYVKWFKWVLKYQIVMLIISIIFLWIGLKVGY